MTYETQTTLEPAWASWLSDEENLAYTLNPPQVPEDYVPWDGWDPDCHIGSVSGPAATQDNILKLHGIAGTQAASDNAEYVTNSYEAPSLELFMEMIWDRTEHLEMTDDEVRDLAIWSGHKFLGYSQRDLAQAWDTTRGAVQGVIRKFDRREDKPQGLIDMQNACLVCFG